ncbi:excinuclease ABC subunit C [Paeniclostridium sordellii]|nr:excinuclease ABC subunit C [Paeniclostridium sordellii]
MKTILSVIPEKPGCYQYFDENGTIIYVGKAKNLKRRVSSYFNKVHDSNKTRVLVKQIRDIKYIVVDTEEDALLLENNLIKQYRPRYNVLLKDDKTYPSIVVKNEYFPRVFQTRNIVRDGSQYYGPYPSLFTAKVMLQMLKELYPLRTCKYPLTPESIAQGRYKVCLEYHIKRCKGPCEGLQSLEEYQQNISEIKEILRGNISQISKHLYEEMQSLAAELKFEEAQKIKEKYEVIENYRSKSTVVTPMLHNIDVFTWFSGLKPVKAVGFGSRHRRITGDQYDNFSVDFTMENGIHMHSMCRQIDGCANNVSEFIQGTKGSWSSDTMEIKDLAGNVIWKYDSEAEKANFKQTDPYTLEHVNWINCIRGGKQIEQASETAISNMAAIMGREAAYTGTETTWDAMTASALDYTPKDLNLGKMDMSGFVVPVPGKPIDKK